MTKKQIVNATYEHHQLDRRDYSVSAGRNGGRCVVVITKRPLKSWERPVRLIVGCAASWQQAERQMRSGYIREAS